MTHIWSKREHEFVEALKTMNVSQAAQSVGYAPSYGYTKLRLMRNKIKDLQTGVNVANNWRRSSPRVRKLLTDGSIESDEE